MNNRKSINEKIKRRRLEYIEAKDMEINYYKKLAFTYKKETYKLHKMLTFTTVSLVFVFISFLILALITISYLK